MGNSLLIIEDSKTTRHQIVELLKENSLFSNFYEASDGHEAFHTILREKIDMVICDLEMPEADGFRFMRMLNTRAELSDLPVLMLTVRNDLQDKIRGFEFGVRDYITKPFLPAELLARVKIHLKLKSREDLLRQQNEDLERMSKTDSLTRLPNRRFLMETLEAEICRCQRRGTPFSLVMIDLDYFKKINDTFGHPQGDQVLVELADLLRQHLREYDSVARYGGEEFALILPATTEEQALIVTERLRQAVQRIAFPAPLAEVSLTISQGIATFRQDTPGDAEDLLRRADAALYLAKTNGRNCIETNVVDTDFAKTS